VLGGDEIFRALSEHMGIGHDETTADGAITLERIECNAACDYAPVLMVNWEFFDNQTPASARDLADQLRGGEARGPKRDALVEGIRLSDGGLYDNLGLEPVWKSRAVLLVSDGGATFDFAADRGLLGRLSRYTAVQGRQVSALRKRWLIAGFIAGSLEGTYWGIGSAAAHYAAGAPGYSQELVSEVISQVRTDLDAFSAAECAVLENHGYLLAEAAIRKHAPALAESGAVAAAPPHPDWLDEGRVRRALADSDRTLLLGRW
jgi:NTE family protein